MYLLPLRNGEGNSYTAANTISAPFSPIAIDGIFVFDDGIVGQIDESITAQSTSTYFVTYLAPDGRALATSGDANGIIVGHWRIEARPGRSYPRVCTAFLVVANAPPPQPDSDSWSCRWPSELLRTNRNRNQVYRGDVLGLADGRVPAPVRAQTGELDITMFWNAQPRRPENLLSLLPNQ